MLRKNARGPEDRVNTTWTRYEVAVLVEVYIRLSRFTSRDFMKKDAEAYVRPIWLSRLTNLTPFVRTKHFS